MSDWAVWNIHEEPKMKDYMIPYVTDVKPGDLVEITHVNRVVNGKYPDYYRRTVKGIVLGNYTYHILIDVIYENISIPTTINKIDILLGDYEVKRIL